MNKLILIFTVFLLFTCNCKTKEQKSSEEKIVSNEITEIEFEEKIVDLGKVLAGEIVVFSFKFKNIGNYNLIIEKIETDCGCVQTKFSEKPVKQDQSGVIEVFFDSAGLYGKQFKSIQIYSNTKEPKQIAIFAEVKNEQIEIKY